MTPPDSYIVCGDCLTVLPGLPRARMIFADPPDNLGQKYADYSDNLPHSEYYSWLGQIALTLPRHADWVWLSIYAHYLQFVYNRAMMARLFIWHYTFGQHRQTDCANCYRPLLRIGKGSLYPDAIRVPSARQLKYHDKRADPRGRVPGDVWEFPRVCGTYKERRPWAPNQHPEALVERCVLMSTQPGDLVIDPFLGSGTTLRVCQRLGRRCIGIDISPTYCRLVSQDTGVPIHDAP